MGMAKSVNSLQRYKNQFHELGSRHKIWHFFILIYSLFVYYTLYKLIRERPVKVWVIMEYLSNSLTPSQDCSSKLNLWLCSAAIVLLAINVDILPAYQLVTIYWWICILPHVSAHISLVEAKTCTQKLHFKIQSQYKTNVWLILNALHVTSNLNVFNKCDTWYVDRGVVNGKNISLISTILNWCRPKKW